MNRLREEMKVVPRPFWVAAACVYLSIVLLLWLLAFAKTGADTGAWPVWGKVLFSAGMPLLLFIWVLLIGYVYGDARRRGMRHVMWTLLAVFIPNAIGIILYFILRGPLLRACPKCGAAAGSLFPFCPACGTALAQTCPECRRCVEPGWSHCGHCGAHLRRVKPPVPASGQTDQGER